MKPCRVTKTTVSWCAHLEKRLAPEANAHSKGLTVINVSRGDEPGFRTIGVAYKTNASDRGMLLNYCPWCKGSLLAPDVKSRNKGART